MAEDVELVEIRVGFNQQQRQLLEKIRQARGKGESEAEVVQAVFTEWLLEETAS